MHFFVCKLCKNWLVKLIHIKNCQQNYWKWYKSFCKFNVWKSLIRMLVSNIIKPKVKFKKIMFRMFNVQNAWIKTSKKNLTLNIPCWISRKMIIFAWYFQNVMVNIIPPTIMKNGSVVDNVHINTLLSFVGGVKV